MNIPQTHHFVLIFFFFYSSGTLFVAQNIMQACHNLYCSLGGFQEHLLLEDCQTSLVENKFFSLLFFLLLCLH